MKLNVLHTYSPLELSLKSINSKLFKHQQYMWKDTGGTSLQPPIPQASLQGGHYDAYIEGKPRLKKYFGGSFLKAI